MKSVFLIWMIKALSREVTRPDLCFSKMQPGRDLAQLEAVVAWEKWPGGSSFS